MNHKNNKHQWDALGQLDPLWAMVGRNKFSSWSLESFLQTGDYQVEQLMRDFNGMGYPKLFENVLDYGCGVGRLARAFATHFDSYTGLDISEKMIVKAKEINNGFSNVTFSLNSSEKLELPSNNFDLVYSWAVLQHIGDRDAVLGLLTEFVRVLRPGGMLVFNAMTHIKLAYQLQPRRRLYALLSRMGVSDSVLYNRLRLYPQELHFIPQDQVNAHLISVGAEMLKIKPYSPPHAPHQVRVFYATK